MDESQSKEIFYIYAPPWVDWSAGIRVLHFLCDQLNESGFETYLTLHGPKTTQEVCANLNTPVVIGTILKTHIASGRKIVAIYPESIVGNPLNAKYVIRWILNYPALLAGSRGFEGETVLAYSHALAVATDALNPPPVLFVPALKSSDFRKSEENSEDLQSTTFEKYELIYAQKYRALGGKLPKLMANHIEITRFGKNAPDRSLTLQLIDGASVVHVYENTTVITEALLLGTPVVCHKNEYFDELIAGVELPMTGITWDPEHLEPPDVRENFAIFQGVESKLQENIKGIFRQIELKEQPQMEDNELILPKRGLVTSHSLSRARVIFTQKGPFALFRFFMNYISR